MTRPVLVIISGPPASGKSTLARPLAERLGMPLLAKDAIKERIADALGPTAMNLSGPIGLAAILTLYDAAYEILAAGQPVVLESFFHHGKAEQDLMPLVSLADAVLVHCTADRHVLLHRYARRISAANRHAIHGDTHRLDDLRDYLNNGTTDLLDFPIPRLVIDTTNAFPDPLNVAKHIHSLLEGEHGSIERNI